MCFVPWLWLKIAAEMGGKQNKVLVVFLILHALVPSIATRRDRFKVSTERRAGWMYYVGSGKCERVCVSLFPSQQWVCLCADEKFVFGNR